MRLVMNIDKNRLKKINNYLWEIPADFHPGMKVPVRIFAHEKMLDEILSDRSLIQLTNVATLPGIKKFAIGLPDMHEGYGFPIGGVAAFDYKNGIVSPGGIGYDINCGVKLLRSSKKIKEIENNFKELARQLYHEVPSGVGQGGKLKLNDLELGKVLERGAEYMVGRGFGKMEDLEKIESGGIIKDADSRLVSERAKARGRDQLGTLGAGNHFLEVDRVEKIFNKKEADKLGIFEGQAVVLIHTGSRGLGHQVATDYIRRMLGDLIKNNIDIIDRELAYAPFNSQLGQEYFKAMSAGANFAWANRQMITHEVREAWKNTFGQSGGELDVVYDVAHNIAKIEEYELGGKKQKLIVHRKGATRAFPDQPVIIPGSMGTASYLLVGREKSLKESFGSTCHGAGRRMSRTKAKQSVRGFDLRYKLEEKGIIVNTGSIPGLAEEAPEAYKDVDEVVDVVHEAGIAEKVARLKPVIVIKG